MLHPVGSLPPQVYWRRRLMLAGVLAAVVLIVLTVVALGSGGSAGGDPTSSAKTGVSGSPSGSTSSTGASSTSPSPSSSVDATTASSAASSSATAATPTPCLPAQLTIAATSAAPTYKVGDEPVLMLQVTNNGPGNCTQDLADSQVELRVYNGAARVWGSHDCLVQPGTSVKTLAVGTTVGVQITWSGLSSQPACAGTRQRVGAGTYTVFPYLAGAQGTTATFTIS